MDPHESLARLIDPEAWKSYDYCMANYRADRAQADKSFHIRALGWSNTATEAVEPSLAAANRVIATGYVLG